MNDFPQWHRAGGTVRLAFSLPFMDVRWLTGGLPLLARGLPGAGVPGQNCLCGVRRDFICHQLL
jgi:hypothetical protein